MGVILSRQSKQDLAQFLGGSVLPGTNRVYEGHWTMWKDFLKLEVNREDPFLPGMEDGEKSALVALLMLRRHQAGHRGKRATSFTAGVRMRFAQETLPTTFLDSAVISTARSACKLSTAELRTRRNGGIASSVKLPASEDLLVHMRGRLWDGLSWCDVDMQKRMTYLGSMWAFEMGARVSEYTRPEPGNEDHCVRTDDLSFTVETDGCARSVVGSALAALGLVRGAQGPTKVLECRVLAASSKGKIPVKPKYLGRRSPAESQFLDDLIEFMVRSGTRGTEELLSYRQSSGRRIPLSGSAVREELKNTCRLHGLPPDLFSSHSLRKGTITHMRARGTTEDDRRDRGNYSAGSQVMNMTYDYATGLGPLAANSLTGGYMPTVEDVRRLIPATRQALEDGAV